MTRIVSISLSLLVFLLAGFLITTGNAFGAASVDVAINGFSQGKANHAGWESTGDWSKQLRTQTSLTWHPNESVTIAQATAWRGKTADATGFHYLGARYYEPNGGRFLSADPAGHGASISLYDYANGDPVNFADPDGRIGKAIGSSLGIQSSSSSGISYRAPTYGITSNSFKTVSTFAPTHTAGNILSAGFNMIPVLGTPHPSYPLAKISGL